jgi:hypothetical protein
MKNTEIKESHLEREPDECRWCFAIDSKRISGDMQALYDFHDGILIKYSCPRCGGEFSTFVNTWTSEYLRELIYKLYPKLTNEAIETLLNEANYRAYYDCEDVRIEEAQKMHRKGNYKAD